MNIKKWHIAGFFFVFIAGVLLHFAYDYSGGNRFVSYISPVNESTWEHLKLVFWPFVFWSGLEYVFSGKKSPDFFAAKATAAVGAMTFITVFFYTYTGVIGFNIFAVDIMTFAVAVILQSVISYRLSVSDNKGDSCDNIKGFVILMLIAMCFIVWTDNAPDLGIFWG